MCLLGSLIVERVGARRIVDRCHQFTMMNDGYLPRRREARKKKRFKRVEGVIGALGERTIGEGAIYILPARVEGDEISFSHIATVARLEVWEGSMQRG